MLPANYGDNVVAVLLLVMLADGPEHSSQYANLCVCMEVHDARECPKLDSGHQLCHQILPWLDLQFDRFLADKGCIGQGLFSGPLPLLD